MGTRDGRLATALLVAAFAVRLVMAWRLGLGRDELAYWYWAWHGLDASSSPITAIALRVSTTALGDGALAIRLPGLLAGFAAALLAIRVSRRLGAAAGAARWAGAALAVAPWQGYAGTVAHPDAFLVLFLLLFADRAAAILGRSLETTQPGDALLDAAVAAGLAALSKPTGALLLPFVIVLAWRQRRATPGAAVGAVALAIVAGVGLFVARDAQLLEGLREFGRFAPGSSATTRALLLLVEITLLAGPALLAAAGSGVGLALRRNPAPARRGAARFLLALAAALLAFHVAFAVLGQAKGNWFLPPLALLATLGVAAPSAARRARASLTIVSLAMTVVFAAGTLVLQNPTWRRYLAATPVGARVDPTYALHVGAREAAVSPSRRWSDRFAEASTPPRVPRPPGTWRPPRLFGNDYGLAFQVAHLWGRDAEVFLPWDPVYHGTCGEPPAPDEDLIFVSRSLAAPPPDVAKRFQGIEPFETPSDPNDPGLVVLYCRSWQPGPEVFAGL